MSNPGDLPTRPGGGNAGPRPNIYQRLIGASSTDAKAGTEFANQLVIRAGNVTDQEHAESMHLQRPSAPSFEQSATVPDAIIAQKQNIDTLHRTGVQVMLFTDTAAYAHLGTFRDYAKQHAPGMELVDVPHATVESLNTRAPHAQNVGLIASPHTTSQNVFQNHASEKNWVVPENAGHLTMVAAEKKGASATTVNLGIEELKKAVTEMASNPDVHAIVVGYPGLSKELGDSIEANGRSVPLICSANVAGTKALELAKKQTPAPAEFEAGCCGCLPVVQQLLETSWNKTLGSLLTKSQAKEPEYKPKAGVMAGQGALAGVQFMGETGDLDMLVHQATHISDRTAFIKGLEGATDPRPEMKRSVDLLSKAGVTHIAVTCNTAHSAFKLKEFLEENNIDITQVHIVGAALENIEKQQPGTQHVALMSTVGTRDSKLYQNFGNNPYEWHLPSDDMQDIATRSIYKGIKQNNLAEGQKDAATVVDSIVAGFEGKLAAGVHPVIVLGCTEFPVALPKAMREARWPNVIFIDTLASLGSSLIEKTGMPIPNTTANAEAVGRAAVELNEERLAA